MTPQRRFILRDKLIAARAQEFIGALPREPLYEVIVREFHEKRSLEANAYYWDQVVTPSADHFGYTPDEMHEEFLCAVFGTSDRTGLDGSVRKIPRKRSSGLNKKEFSWYVDRCRQIAIENGAPLQ